MVSKFLCLFINFFLSIQSFLNTYHDYIFRKCKKKRLDTQLGKSSSISETCFCFVALISKKILIQKADKLTKKSIYYDNLSAYKNLNVKKLLKLKNFKAVKIEKF